MRGGASHRLTHLGPDKLHRVQFGSSYWKGKEVKAWLIGQKILHQFALMDRMVIPNSNQATRNQAEPLVQKGNHLPTSQAMPVGFDTQSHFLSSGQDQQCTHDIQTHRVVNTGV